MMDYDYNVDFNEYIVVKQRQKHAVQQYCTEVVPVQVQHNLGSVAFTEMQKTKSFVEKRVLKKEATVRS